MRRLKCIITEDMRRQYKVRASHYSKYDLPSALRCDWSSSRSQNPQPPKVCRDTTFRCHLRRKLGKFVAMSASSTPMSTTEVEATTLTTSVLRSSWPTIPLTAVFTPAEACKQRHIEERAMLLSSEVFGGLHSYFYSKGQTEGACYPYDATKVPLYSPGVCPSGWFAQTTAVYDQKTTSYCCAPYDTQSRFLILKYMLSMYRDMRLHVYTNGLAACTKLITTPTSVFFPWQSWGVRSSFVVMDQVIMIAWESSDLDVFTPASAPLIRDLQATKAPPSPQTTELSMPGLSKGAKAGAVIGSIFGLALLIGLAILMNRMRRYRLSLQDRSIVEPEKEDSGTRQVDSDSSALYKANGDSRLSEADFANSRAELEGHWHGYEMT